jgi:hypothetical protein
VSKIELTSFWRSSRSHHIEDFEKVLTVLDEVVEVLPHIFRLWKFPKNLESSTDPTSECTDIEHMIGMELFPVSLDEVYDSSRTSRVQLIKVFLDLLQHLGMSGKGNHAPTLITLEGSCLEVEWTHGNQPSTTSFGLLSSPNQAWATNGTHVETPFRRVRAELTGAENSGCFLQFVLARGI